MSSAAVRPREAVERGRDWERRRVLKIVDDWAYAASISPNGEITENVLDAIKREITEGRDR